MSLPRVLVVHPADSDPVGRLGEWLSAAGLDLDIVDGPDVPATLDGYAAIVVLGGGMGANYDEQFPGEWCIPTRTARSWVRS